MNVRGIRKLALGVVVLALSAGCDDDERVIEVDASSGGKDEPLTDAAAPALTSDDWQIELKSGACLGTCPEFSVSIDGQGRVSYVGQRFTHLQGPHEKQVPRNEAAHLYGLLANTVFWRLPRTDYASPASCPMWWTDGPTYAWTVRVGSVVRSLQVNDGCRGIDGIDPIVEVGRVFPYFAHLEQWLGVPIAWCLYCDEPSSSAAASYRVQVAGRTLGVLRLDGYETFQLVDCAEQLVARGALRRTSSGTRLVPSGPLRVSSDAPASDVILFNPLPDGGVAAEARGDDGVLPLALSEAEGC